MYKFTFIFVSLLSALMGKKSMDHISVGMYRNLKQKREWNGGVHTVESDDTGTFS